MIYFVQTVVLGNRNRIKVVGVRRYSLQCEPAGGVIIRINSTVMRFYAVCTVYRTLF